MYLQAIGLFMSKYDDFDEYWCREFAPLKALQATWAASGERVKEYAAATSGQFRHRFLVKPKDGFVSQDHEDFFVKNANVNRNHGHYIAANVGFSEAPVWKNFQAAGGWLFRIPFAIFGKRVTTHADQKPGDQVPNSKQPYGGNSLTPDDWRDIFEHYWESGVGASKLLYRARQEVAQLDRDYANLESDADREAYLAANPGYRPRPDDEEDVTSSGLTVEEVREQLRKRRQR